MTEDEYKKRRSHFRSINVMTADCDPEDELAELRNRFIEERAQELLRDLYDTPERMQEYILESPYENTCMLKMCEHLGNILQFPSSSSVIEFLGASGTFFEEATMNEAIEQESNI